VELLTDWLWSRAAFAVGTPKAGLGLYNGSCNRQRLPKCGAVMIARAMASEDSRKALLDAVMQHATEMVVSAK